MALHKPIVTTDMNECRKYKSVLIGEDHNDFIEKLDNALKLATDANYIALLHWGFWIFILFCLKHL